MADINDFHKLDIRVGKIVEVNDYPESRKPSYRIKIDFGEEVGIKQSIGQFTHYKKAELLGRLVAGVVNMPAFRMGSEKSEVLTLGFPDSEGRAILVIPEKDVPIGGKLF
jgi:tRNA-binding protein